MEQKKNKTDEMKKDVFPDTEKAVTFESVAVRYAHTVFSCGRVEAPYRADRKQNHAERIIR